MKGRRASIAGALAASALACGAAPAVAGTTGTLGNPGEYAVSSACPAGSYVNAITVTLDPRGPYIHTLTVQCSDGSSGARIGEDFWYDPEVQSSNCAEGVATGFFGRAGDIVDAVGVTCTGENGALTGGQGGAAPQTFDCAAHERLTAIEGTYTDYFGAPTVASLTGVCTDFAAAAATTKDECKDGDWQDYGDRYRNQGDCVSEVVSNRPS